MKGEVPIKIQWKAGTDSDLLSVNISNVCAQELDKHFFGIVVEE